MTDNWKQKITTANCHLKSIAALGKFPRAVSFWSKTKDKKNPASTFRNRGSRLWSIRHLNRGEYGLTGCLLFQYFQSEKQGKRYRFHEGYTLCSRLRVCLLLTWQTMRPIARGQSSGKYWSLKILLGKRSSKAHNHGLKSALAERRNLLMGQRDFAKSNRIWFGLRLKLMLTKVRIHPTNSQQAAVL